MEQADTEIEQKALPDFRRPAVIAVLVGLAFLGTMFIRITIPATTGYFNLGDIFVILAGIWLGPRAGLVVGALGPAAADAIGFPQFIVATAIIKGLEGLIVGLIAKSRPVQGVGLSFVASFAGSVIMVGGYFLFETAIYPALAKHVSFFDVTTFGAAITELLPNTIQGIIGAVLGVALWRAVSGGRSVRDPK